jgi:transcriptional regulator with XRE-family HTH domain
MYERNLNQIQLAALLGMRQSQVSNWLSGKSLPGYLSLCSLIERLELQPSELFMY